MEENKVTEAIIGAAIEVHRQLGPGLFEKTYQACLEQELTARGVAFEREKHLPVLYKGVRLDDAYRIDLLVENKVIVKVKSVAALAPVHEAQLLTYLKLTGMRIGLLLNFNTRLLKDGLKRLVNT